MLVISRKKEEGFRIGDQVYVKVLEVRHGRVRLGIEAPPDVDIVREELIDADGHVTPTAMNGHR